MVTSRALTTTVTGVLWLGKAAWMRSKLRITGMLRDRDSVPGIEVCIPNAGIARATRTPPLSSADSDGPAKHPLDDPRPDPVRFALLRGASATRKPSLLDAVSECGQHRGQHGEGPEHRHRNDEDRPGGKGREGWRAAEVHAGHRDHHRDARYEHRATGRGGRRLDRGAVDATGGSLLAHALEVEQ